MTNTANNGTEAVEKPQHHRGTIQVPLMYGDHQCLSVWRERPGDTYILSADNSNAHWSLHLSRADVAALRDLLSAALESDVVA